MGDLKFGSLNLHDNRPRSYRDDLESLFYTILYLGGVKLPWIGHGPDVGRHYKSRIDDMRVSKIRKIRNRKNIKKKMEINSIAAIGYVYPW